jgi:transposase-like protein
MKQILSLTPAQRTTTPLTRRRQLLAEFERSGLSIAAFARQHGIGYSTFCAWRRRATSQPNVCFAEIELERSVLPEAIVVELGRQARMRLSSAHQLQLAARLLKELEVVC